MKTFLKVLIKSIVLLSVAICSWVWLTPYFRVDRNTMGEEFRNIPDHCLDVVALGSSHIQYAFNPAVFYAHSGYYSYVLGSPCQPFSMTYHMLAEALKTQSPSVAVVDVFTLLQQSQICYVDGMYYQAMQEMTGENRVDAGRQVPDRKLGLQYTFDLIMNHSNWRTMNFSDLKSIAESARPSTHVSDTLGYVSQMPTIFRYTPLVTYTPAPAELSDSAKKEIDDLIDLCDARGIRLIFIKTPYIIDQADTDRLNAIWNYLDSRNQIHLDFIAMAKQLNWFIDMDGDTWHDNVWGANIVTSYLADYIRQKGMVSAHQDNEGFQRLLEPAMSKTSRFLLGPENLNVYTLLPDAKLYPCTILLKYTGGFFPTGSYEYGLLDQISPRHPFTGNTGESYYAIIKNGTVMQDGTAPFAAQLDGKSISLSDDGITIDGKSYDDSPGQLEMYLCGNGMTWVNPIGITPTEYGFWKKGCLSWDCSGSN